MTFKSHLQPHRCGCAQSDLFLLILCEQPSSTVINDSCQEVGAIKNELLRYIIIILVLSAFTNKPCLSLTSLTRLINSAIICLMSTETYLQRISNWIFIPHRCKCRRTQCPHYKRFVNIAELR